MNAKWPAARYPKNAEPSTSRPIPMSATFGLCSWQTGAVPTYHSLFPPIEPVTMIRQLNKIRCLSYRD
jgi:hypothetical protein